MIYELRNYEAHVGRAEELRRRFIAHVAPIIEDHGIEIVGIWTLINDDDRMFYITRGPDEAALKRGWEAFAMDERWLSLRDRTETGGPMLKTASVVLARAYPGEK